MATLSKITIAFTLLIGLLFLSPTNSFGQSKSIFDVMHYQEVLEITIEADLDSLKNSRRTDDYQKAYLSFKDKKDELQGWKMKLRTRGKFRRKMGEMPPLKMKFKKAELAVADLNEFNDMKLVTHSVASKEEAKKLLMKEYLAYRMYETLTENSYRTQLVRITYQDIKTGKKTKNWGFLLEDTAQLADRMQAEKCDYWGSKPADFQDASLEVMNLFQYMIGNEDFIVEDLKNVKIFRKEGKLIPVPYDFDFSGLVNASYAIPNRNYGLNNVTERMYLGELDRLQELHCAQMLFHVKEQEIKSVITDFKKLDFDSKSTMIAYLEEFFEHIDELRVPQNMVEVEDKKTLLQTQVFNKLTKE